MPGGVASDLSARGEGRQHCLGDVGRGVARIEPSGIDFGCGAVHDTVEDGGQPRRGQVGAEHTFAPTALEELPDGNQHPVVGGTYLCGGQGAFGGGHQCTGIGSE